MSAPCASESHNLVFPDGHVCSRPFADVGWRSHPTAGETRRAIATHVGSSQLELLAGTSGRLRQGRKIWVDWDGSDRLRPARLRRVEYISRHFVRVIAETIDPGEGGNRPNHQLLDFTPCRRSERRGDSDRRASARWRTGEVFHWKRTDGKTVRPGCITERSLSGLRFTATRTDAPHRGTQITPAAPHAADRLGFHSAVVRRVEASGNEMLEVSAEILS